MIKKITVSLISHDIFVTKRVAKTRLQRILFVYLFYSEDIYESLLKFL